jgi:hypothetical protein
LELEAKKRREEKGRESLQIPQKQKEGDTGGVPSLFSFV